MFDRTAVNSSDLVVLAACALNRYNKSKNVKSQECQSRRVLQYSWVPHQIELWCCSFNCFRPPRTRSNLYPLIRMQWNQPGAKLHKKCIWIDGHRPSTKSSIQSLRKSRPWVGMSSVPGLVMITHSLARELVRNYGKSSKSANKSRGFVGEGAWFSMIWIVYDSWSGLKIDFRGGVAFLVGTGEILKNLDRSDLNTWHTRAYHWCKSLLSLPYPASMTCQKRKRGVGIDKHEAVLKVSGMHWTYVRPPEWSLQS